MTKNTNLAKGLAADNVKVEKTCTFPTEFSIPGSPDMFGKTTDVEYVVTSVWWAGDNTVFRCVSPSGEAWYDCKEGIFLPEKPAHSGAMYPFRTQPPTKGRKPGTNAEKEADMIEEADSYATPEDDEI